jgi:hypothetical protein
MKTIAVGVFCVSFVTSLVCAVGGCVSDEQSLDSVTEAVDVPTSVPVGDPIQMISAPPVFVTAQVGDSITFTSAGPTCSVNCSYTWRDPDHGIPRFGGVILGYGPTLTITENAAGSSRVTLGYCVRTSPRFSRCISTFVYVTTTAPSP